MNWWDPGMPWMRRRRVSFDQDDNARFANGTFWGNARITKSTSQAMPELPKVHQRQCHSYQRYIETLCFDLVVTILFQHLCHVMFLSIGCKDKNCNVVSVHLQSFLSRSIPVWRTLKNTVVWWSLSLCHNYHQCRFTEIWLLSPPGVPHQHFQQCSSSSQSRVPEEMWEIFNCLYPYVFFQVM